MARAGWSSSTRTRGRRPARPGEYQALVGTLCLMGPPVVFHSVSAHPWCGGRVFCPDSRHDRSSAPRSLRRVRPAGRLGDFGRIGLRGLTSTRPAFSIRPSDIRICREVRFAEAGASESRRRGRARVSARWRASGSRYPLAMCRTRSAGFSRGIPAAVAYVGRQRCRVAPARWGQRCGLVPITGMPSSVCAWAPRPGRPSGSGSAQVRGRSACQDRLVAETMGA
jgi:hypothetical protein